MSIDDSKILVISGYFIMFVHFSLKTNTCSYMSETEYLI